MKNEKTEATELDLAGLLALKKFEHPDAGRNEKNIQNIMRVVRETNNVPSLLLFPDKSFAWMFTQPRYGIAALFLLFLGLHLLDRPIPGASAGPGIVMKVPDMDIMADVNTNGLKSAVVPGIKPPFSLAGEPDALSARLK
jgi:hypothetical protein